MLSCAGEIANSERSSFCAIGCPPRRCQSKKNSLSLMPCEVSSAASCRRSTRAHVEIACTHWIHSCLCNSSCGEVVFNAKPAKSWTAWLEESLTQNGGHATFVCSVNHFGNKSFQLERLLGSFLLCLSSDASTAMLATSASIQPPTINLTLYLPQLIIESWVL